MRETATRVLLATTVLTALAAPARADDPGAPADETITVTATRLPTPVADIGSAVSVVTATDIALLQRRTVPDLLANLPGLNVVRSGAWGGQSSVFVRGTNNSATKVRIDGMDANDPSTPDGSFDYGPLLTAGIARLEVLRGPQSGLYGADAMGGVIDITTLAGGAKPRAAVTLEGGSFSTFNQTASASGSTGRFHYAAVLTHQHVGGVQVTPRDLIPPGETRQHNHDDERAAIVRLGYDVTRHFDVGVVTWLSQHSYRFTGDDYSYYPSIPAAAQSRSDTNQALVRGTAHLSLWHGIFDQVAGVGYIGYRRRDVSGGSFEPSFNRGDRLKADWHGTLRLGTYGTALVGYDHLRERITDSPVTAQTTTDAGYGQLQLHWRDLLYGAANVRGDSNSRWGDHVTWRAAPSLHVPGTGLILKASGGSGFHGPSLNQLFVSYPDYGFYANPNLRPEKLIGYDAGAEEHLWHERLQFGATWFHNHVTNLIETNATYDSYDNVADASMHGIESFVAVRPLDTVTLRADYTWTRAMDETDHTELLRRPKHKLSVDGTWQPIKALALNADVLWLSSWADTGRESSAPVRGRGYAVVNLSAQYELTRHVTLFGRVDNLLDRHYQNPNGFLQPGASVFGGATLHL